jgi:hypothetical protein
MVVSYAYGLPRRKLAFLVFGFDTFLRPSHQSANIKQLFKIIVYNRHASTPQIQWLINLIPELKNIVDMELIDSLDAEIVMPLATWYWL